MNRVTTGSDVAVRLPLLTDPTTGELADCDSDPTCSVARADGTVLADADVSNLAGSLGAYSALLLAATHVDQVDRLTLTVDGLVGGNTVSVTDYVDVAGRFYLSNGELRQPHGLDNAVDFPMYVLRDLCSAFEAQVENWCGRALVPRYVIERRAGSGRSTLVLSRRPVREIVSSSYSWLGSTTALTITGWDGSASGVIVTTADVFPTGSDVTVHYRAGEDAPSESIKEAARIWIRDQAMKNRSQMSRGTLSTTDPYGTTIRMSTPDWGSGNRPTGLFGVDEALAALGRDIAVA